MPQQTLHAREKGIQHGKLTLFGPATGKEVGKKARLLSLKSNLSDRKSICEEISLPRGGKRNSRKGRHSKNMPGPFSKGQAEKQKKIFAGKILLFSKKSAFSVGKSRKMAFSCVK